MDIVKLQLSGLNFFRTVINSDFDKQNVFFYICDDKLNLMYSLNEDYEYIKPLSFKFNFGKILYFSRKNKNDQFERFFPIFYADKKKVACFFVLVGSFDFVDLCTPKVNLFLKNITYTETTKNEFHKITENEDGTLNFVNIKKDKVTNTKTEEKKTTRVHPHHNFKTVYDKLNEEIDNYLLIIRRKDNKQLLNEEIKMFKTYFDKYETKLGSTQVYLVVYINKKMRFSFNDLKQQFSNYFIYISENYSENDYQNVKLLIKALMKIKNPIMRDNLIFYEDNIAQSIIIYNYLQYPQIYSAKIAKLHKIYQDKVLADFLNEYVKSGLSATNTSTILKIHRNTVLNRLKKIEKALNLKMEHFPSKITLYSLIVIYINLKRNIVC